MTAVPFTANRPLRRRAWWLLVAIHVPSIGFVIAQGGLRLAFPGPAPHEVIALPLTIIASAIQLRHSVAAAQGFRPRYWSWTLLLLCLIAFLPLPTLKDQVITMQWFVVASFAMLLPGRVALVASLVTGVGTGIWFAITTQLPNAGPGQILWSFCVLGGAAVPRRRRPVRRDAPRAS